MEATMKDGEFTIRRITANERGYSYPTFQLVGRMNGERIRKRFRSKDEAEGAKNAFEVEAANTNSGTRAINTRLTAAQVATAETIFTLTADPLAAVQWHLANYRPPVMKKPLPDAIAAFLADRSPHVRITALRDYKATLEALTAAFPGHSVDSVKSDDLASYLAGRGVGKKRFNNLRGDLNAFFRFCAASPRKWTLENPVTPIAKFKISRGIPEIITPEKASELMAFAETFKGGLRSPLPAGCLVPYFALALFAGLRPSVPNGEIWKLAQEEPPGKSVDLALGIIRISPDVSKVKSIRQVKIQPNLAEWLKRYPLDKFPLIPTNAQALITEVRKKFGLGADILRHTMISAHVAKFKSLGAAALEAGNSETMIRKHYLNMLSDTQADAFWSIAPKF